MQKTKKHQKHKKLTKAERKELVGLYGGYPHTVLTKRAKDISDSGYMVISESAFKKRRAFGGY